MKKRYLVVSDLHLCDVEDHLDGWKSYKSSRFVFDQDFARLLASFQDEAEEETSLVLILNGDIFDFDLVTAVPQDPPWPLHLLERRHGLHATAEKSRWKLERILQEHPLFFEALTRFLLNGHHAVYVLGNHDREFAFPLVQQTLQEHLRQCARSLGGELNAEPLQFEPWFYAVPGEIYAEHGQQYDHYTSFRYVLSPTIDLDGEERLALPMGNLSNRYLMSHMGTFNPHSGEFILNLYSYVYHWLTQYALTRRSLFFSWFVGSLLVMARLLRTRRYLHRRSPPDLEEHILHTAQRFQMEPATVRSLYQLQYPPITSRFFRIVREFWIDRLLLALLMTAGTVTLALVPVPLWVKLMVPLVGFPLLYFLYEWVARGETIFAIETEFPRVAREIARLFPVRVVTFGHTHVPRLIPLLKEITFVDTGTWAPVTRRTTCTHLSPGYRNYLILSIDGPESSLTFDSWLPAQDPALECPELPASLLDSPS